MPFYDLNTTPPKDLLPGFLVHFVHGDQMTLAHWTIEAGAVLPEHSHPHEQVANVLEGEFELTIDGETKILEAGTVAVIPSNAVHSGKAVTNCRIIDTFNPVREDYR